VHVAADEVRALDIRVAVVIPCHNDGRFLPDALASVGEQEACELVVVDDGSTDPLTLRVLGEAERGGILVVRQSNKGPGEARMAGVRATQAKYVHPLDADDRLAPGTLTALADALDANPEARAAWGDVRSIGSKACTSPKAPCIDPWRITYLNEIPGTCLMRRKTLEEVNGWDLPFGYEDWDFWMKLAERGWDGVRLPRVTLLYREHATPRGYMRDLARHEKLRALLRSRHPGLFRARSTNWRKSRSALPVKLLFPLIDKIPLMSSKDKQRAWVRIRNMFEPQMKPSCKPSPDESTS
jgi:glycosyltransferase involved in cell wall biosynthesis